ncbi:hypothetical protein CLU79DRAFT_817584 [Phycomyces nitens]|nr:hypothetical protein CLU79DRAFT_817584 [Phycomyces nitens]
MLRSPVSPQLLSYVSKQASMVIPCDDQPDVDSDKNPLVLPHLHTFVCLLIRRSSMRSGTILAALVFLNRLQQRLSLVARGSFCTCHRIFLATLIITAKSLHDSSPKNKHWARYAMYFNLTEVNLMEIQLLALLDYELIIDMEELQSEYVRYYQSSRRSSFLELYPQPNPPQYSPQSLGSITSCGDLGLVLHDSTFHPSTYEKTLPAVVPSISITQEEVKVAAAPLDIYPMGHKSTFVSSNDHLPSLSSSISSSTSSNDLSIDADHSQLLNHNCSGMNMLTPVYPAARLRDSTPEEPIRYKHSGINNLTNKPDLPHLPKPHLGHKFSIDMFVELGHNSKAMGYTPSWSQEDGSRFSYSPRIV